MTVKIITDSTSDLTPEIASELDITVVPLSVHFDGVAYRDGIDLTTQDFYRKLEQCENLPTTATPAPGIFADAYDQVAEKTDEILAKRNLGSIVVCYSENDRVKVTLKEEYL